MIKYYIIVGRDIYETKNFNSIEDAVSYTVEKYKLSDYKERWKSDGVIKFSAMHNGISTGCHVCIEEYINLEGWQELLDEKHQLEYFNEYYENYTDLWKNEDSIKN